MDAAITNVGTETLFISGPNLNLDPGETKAWNDILLTDLDGSAIIKDGIVAGTIAVSITPDARDAAQVASSGGKLGLTDGSFLPAFAFADLPAGVIGRTAFVTDGRAGAEGAAAGTGCPVVYSNGDWRRLEDMAVVAA